MGPFTVTEHRQGQSRFCLSINLTIVKALREDRHSSPVITGMRA